MVAPPPLDCATATAPPIVSAQMLAASLEVSDALVPAVTLESSMNARTVFVTLL